MQLLRPSHDRSMLVELALGELEPLLRFVNDRRLLTAGGHRQLPTGSRQLAVQRDETFLRFAGIDIPDRVADRNELPWGEGRT